MTISRCRLASAFTGAMLLASGMTAAEPGKMMCIGTRSPDAPVVVLEAGAGAGIEAWAKVAPAIAEFARVCAYDRPGLRRYWTNDEAPTPPTPAQVVDILDRALTNAGERPPYVLVGHSYGGMIVRLFAATFPDRVKGVVLVDSAHEDQLRRYNESPPPLPAPGAHIMMPEIYDIAAMNEALGARPWHATIPLLVVTRGHAGAANGPAPTPDTVARYEIWLELQRELATRSPRAEHLIAKNSGHNIQNDEPQVIVDGVRRIVMMP